MAQKGFRHDINALRAFAVCSVVLYHFQVSLFASGYIGVDIFFVISGFLMTKVICSAFEKDRFSFINFFFSRAKRIIPALLVMCLILLIFGWFYLLPIEYRQLSKHIISSQLFISNIIFSGESGYFDVASTKKYLLHTWSLSVEWQFYMLLPLILVGLLKLKKNLIVPAIFLGLIILSFVYALTLGKPQSVYFSLVSRSWEMLLGGLVYFLPTLTLQPQKQNWYKITSLLLFVGLFISVIAIGSQDVWPNFLALIPVLFTAILIWMNSDLKIFNCRPLNFLGEVSYSLYLWHWPIVVLILNFYQVLTPLSIIIGIIASLVLAYLSYKYVESPIKSLKLSLKSLFASFLVIGLLCMAALYVFKTNGVPSKHRWPEAVYQADLEFLNREPRKAECLTLGGIDSPHCIYGSNENVSLIIFGDSHASAVVTAVKKILPANESLLFIAKAGCPSLIAGGIRQDRGGECKHFVEQQLDYIKNVYPAVPVLVIARWPYYYLGNVSNVSKVVSKITNVDYDELERKFTRSFSTTWCEIAEERNVFALSPLPEYWANVPGLVAKSILNKEMIKNIPKQMFLQRSQFITNGLGKVENSCGVALIDASEVLCNEDECQIHKDNRPIYYDDNHLSEWGNKLLVPVLSKSLSFKKSYKKTK
jgi:peptidoglycan/LPS O-acetylase OafA/YrhL